MLVIAAEEAIVSVLVLVTFVSVTTFLSVLGLNTSFLLPKTEAKSKSFYAGTQAAFDVPMVGVVPRSIPHMLVLTAEATLVRATAAKCLILAKLKF